MEIVTNFYNDNVNLISTIIAFISACTAVVTVIIAFNGLKLSKNSLETNNQFVISQNRPLIQMIRKQYVFNHFLAFRKPNEEHSNEQFFEIINIGNGIARNVEIKLEVKDYMEFLNHLKDPNLIEYIKEKYDVEKIEFEESFEIIEENRPVRKVEDLISIEGKYNNNHSFQNLEFKPVNVELDMISTNTNEVYIPIPKIYLFILELINVIKLDYQTSFIDEINLAYYKEPYLQIDFVYEDYMGHKWEQKYRVDVNNIGFSNKNNLYSINLKLLPKELFNQQVGTVEPNSKGILKGK